MKIEEIIVKIQNSDPVALAKAITFVENRKKGYEKLLSAVHSQKKRSFKIGITGSPGSGKSTLIEKLIAELKKRKIPIGVLAFDPTSPISGGALLGDRIRMLQHSTDPNIFIRSLANRGHLGGLGRSVWEILQLLEAAGKEIIFIETVGVGQSEVEIAAVADVVLTVLTPEAGDDIQVLKAGIMEISDIFVINKSDLGGAENKLNEIPCFFYFVPEGACGVHHVCQAQPRHQQADQPDIRIPVQPSARHSGKGPVV